MVVKQDGFTDDGKEATNMNIPVPKVPKVTPDVPTPVPDATPTITEPTTPAGVDSPLISDGNVTADLPEIGGDRHVAAGEAPRMDAGDAIDHLAPADLTPEDSAPSAPAEPAPDAPARDADADVDAAPAEVTPLAELDETPGQMPDNQIEQDGGAAPDPVVARGDAEPSSSESDVVLDPSGDDVSAVFDDTAAALRSGDGDLSAASDQIRATLDDNPDLPGLDADAVRSRLDELENDTSLSDADRASGLADIYEQLSASARGEADAPVSVPDRIASEADRIRNLNQDTATHEEMEAGLKYGQELIEVLKQHPDLLGRDTTMTIGKLDRLSEFNMSVPMPSRLREIAGVADQISAALRDREPAPLAAAVDEAPDAAAPARSGSDVDADGNLILDENVIRAFQENPPRMQDYRNDSNGVRDVTPVAEGDRASLQRIDEVRQRFGATPSREQVQEYLTAIEEATPGARTAMREIMGAGDIPFDAFVNVLKNGSPTELTNAYWRTAIIDGSTWRSAMREPAADATAPRTTDVDASGNLILDEAAIRAFAENPPEIPYQRRDYAAGRDMTGRVAAEDLPSFREISDGYSEFMSAVSPWRADHNVFGRYRGAVDNEPVANPHTRFLSAIESATPGARQALREIMESGDMPYDAMIRTLQTTPDGSPAVQREHLRDVYHRLSGTDQSTWRSALGEESLYGPGTSTRNGIMDRIRETLGL